MLESSSLHICLNIFALNSFVTGTYNSHYGGYVTVSRFHPSAPTVPIILLTIILEAAETDFNSLDVTKKTQATSGNKL